MSTALPPKERTITPPEGGWKERRYYVVEVAFEPSNLTHQAVLYTGFLNDPDGAPGGYHALWHPLWTTRSTPYKLPDFHYVKALEELPLLS